MKSTKNNFISGVRHSIPIWIGYIPSAITLGILCNTNSLGLLHAFLSSFVLYSGAAQFMLVGFLTSSVPLVGIAVSVFLLNTRLFLMSATLGATVDKVNHKAFPIVGWLLTDESFSILSLSISSPEVIRSKPALVCTSLAITIPGCNSPHLFNTIIVPHQKLLVILLLYLFL